MEIAELVVKFEDAYSLVCMSIIFLLHVF